MVSYYKSGITFYCRILGKLLLLLILLVNIRTTKMNVGRRVHFVKKTTLRDVR